jgi:hypothetical protein
MVDAMRGPWQRDVIPDDLDAGTVGILRVTPSGYRYLISDRLPSSAWAGVIEHLHDHLDAAMPTDGQVALLALCDHASCSRAGAWLPTRCASDTA